MKAGQKSLRGGIQDVLSPFTDWYCTQGAYEKYSHAGSEANDIRGVEKGVKYPYFAPCDLECVRIDRKYCFVWWNSIEKVRFADGTVDYLTLLTGHDETINFEVGQRYSQGTQIGNMGKGGLATGVHCHVEVGKGKQNTWVKNKFGTWTLPSQVPIEKAFFMDNTNIILGVADWKYLKDVSVEEKKGEGRNYINLPPSYSDGTPIDSWNVYSIDKAPIKENAISTINPSKFGGLSYYIHEYRDNGTTAVIEGATMGLIKIYIKGTPATVTIDSYKYNLVK